MSYPAFFALAIPLVLAALGVVLNRHPIRSALSLVVALFLLAVMFLFLDAHLVAALQVVVYAGAVMVLFLFVIMLLSLQEEPSETRRRGWRLVAASAASLFALAAIRAVWARSPGAADVGMGTTPPTAFGTTAALSERLFTQYALPFEITSILLLVASIGAVAVAKRRLG